MKIVISALWMISLLASGTAWAQAAIFPPNAAGVTMGHWHLNSKDPEATKKILVAMGGNAVKFGDRDIVKFPGVVVFLTQGGNAKPASGGTVGSVINHVGFTVTNTAAAVAAWKAAGVQVLPGGNGRTDQAFVETGDGLRIEILENKDQKFPIQHHHVHFFVPEAEIPKIQAWYARFFGATPGMRGMDQAADIPGANLTFRKTDTPAAPTRGRVLDHIGFDVLNLEAFCKQLEAAGITLVRPYTKDAETGAGLANIYDPWGTYIELNERPTPL